MLNKLFNKATKPHLHKQLLFSQLRTFSAAASDQSLAELNKQHHKNIIMDAKFYEKDFWSTAIEEIEYVRSPLYEIAKSKPFGNDELVHEHLEDMNLRLGMMSEIEQQVLSPQDT